MKSFKELVLGEAINKKNIENMKAFLSKNGAKSFDVVDGVMTITFKDTAAASKAAKASYASNNEITAFGDVEVTGGKITIELNSETLKILGEAEAKPAFEDFDLVAIAKTLEDEVSRLIRVKVKFTHKIEKDKIVRYTSQDLSKDMSPRMYKELNVYTWGGEITSEGYIWLSVRFDYSMFDGGSNGHEIIALFVDKNGKVIKKQTKF